MTKTFPVEVCRLAVDTGLVDLGENYSQELKAKAEAIEKREGERRALEEKKHAEEVQFLKRTNAQLKKELETYLQPSKK